MIQIKREVSIFLCAFSQQVYRGPKKGEHQKILTPLLQYIHYTLRQIYQGSIICPVGLSSAVRFSQRNFQFILSTLLRPLSPFWHTLWDDGPSGYKSSDWPSPVFWDPRVARWEPPQQLLSIVFPCVVLLLPPPPIQQELTTWKQSHQLVILYYKEQVFFTLSLPSFWSVTA